VSSVALGIIHIWSAPRARIDPTILPLSPFARGSCFLAAALMLFRAVDFGRLSLVQHVPPLLGQIDPAGVLAGLMLSMFLSSVAWSVMSRTRRASQAIRRVQAAARSTPLAHL
jgi:hypothetical protein